MCVPSTMSKEKYTTMKSMRNKLDKEKISTERTIIYKRLEIRTSWDLTETLKAKKELRNIYKILKEKNYQEFCLATLSIK